MFCIKGTLLLLFAVVIGPSVCFYLPGLAPVTYCDSEKEVNCQVSFLVMIVENHTIF